MSIFTRPHIALRANPEVQRLMEQAYAAKRKGDEITFTRLRKQALALEAIEWTQEHSAPRDYRR